MSKHETLKVWPEHFEELWQFRKTFELRWENRAFEVGTELTLKEFVPGALLTGHYTGREMTAVVSHLMRGPAFGIEAGYVVLSLDDLTRTEAARVPS